MTKEEFTGRCMALSKDINRIFAAHVDSLSPSDGAMVASSVTFSLMAMVAANVTDSDDAAVDMVTRAPWRQLVSHARTAVDAARVSQHDADGSR